MSIFEQKNYFSKIENVECNIEWESEYCPKNPEVSIIMPVYKNYDYFPVALMSAIQQDWVGSYEIVIVDNDITVSNKNYQIVEKFNSPLVRYFRNSENIGAVGNWNRGIQKARGKFVTFLHDDDVFLPTTLSTCMKIASKNPSKMVISSNRPVDKNGSYLLDDDEFALKRRLLIFKPREVAKVSLARALCLNMGNCEATIFNLDNLISLGGFNPDASPIIDYELLVRYCYKYGAVKIRKPNMLYRFADNDSYKVYARVGPKRREIAEEVIRKVHLPYSLMRIIADTYCLDVDINYRRSFASPDEQLPHTVKPMYRLITKIYCNFFNLIEAYKITF
ncbi:MAG: glycosyltransferase [Clostridium sp.]|nr:glycosyltransferase [Clostridium sp.]